MIISHEDLKENLNLSGRLSKFLAYLLYKICKVQKINDLYNKYHHASGNQFVDKILESQNIKISYNQNQAEKIKTHKSLIIIANHPHGILDGLLVIKLLAANGISDTKVVANPLLSSVKTLSDNLIIVNSFDESKDHQLSYRGCKNVLKALKDDNHIVFFPSADVSLFKFNTLKIEDPKWNKTFFKLIERSEYAILPIFIKGRNSIFYQILGLMHHKLSLLCLIPEFFRKKDICIDIIIGDIFFKENINGDDLQILLRKKVYDLNK